MSDTTEDSHDRPERGFRARREPTRRDVDLARAVNLAIAGATYRQIAGEIDVDEETVRYHLTSPEGQRALRYAVNDLQERTDRFLASAHLQALRRLMREMEEAERPSDRIRAAQAITSLAARRIEITGANGGPIAVDSAAVSALDERIATMRERSRAILDAEVIEDTADPVLEIEAAPVPEASPEMPTGSPESVDTAVEVSPEPEPADEAPTASRRQHTRRPASLGNPGPLRVVR